MKKLSFLLIAVCLFTFNAHATLDETISTRLQNDCERTLKGDSTKERSIGYNLQNFMGIYELRFQILEGGTQVVLLPKTYRNLNVRMEHLLSTLLQHYFGSQYHPNGPKREFSDTHRHGWIDQKPNTELIRKIYLAIQNLAQIPDYSTTHWHYFANSAEFKQLAEHYLEQNFPSLSDFRGMQVMTSHFPYFLNRLSVRDRLFADYSIFTKKKPDTDAGLEKLCEFIFGEESNSVEIRRRLRREFFHLLKTNLPKYAQQRTESFGDPTQLPDIEDFRPLYNNNLVTRISTADTYNSLPRGKTKLDRDLKREFAGRTGISKDGADWLNHIHTPTEDAGEELLLVTDLDVSDATMLKLKSTKAIYLVELLKYSAKDLVEKFELTRPQLIELIKELNVVGMHIHFSGNWDRSHFRIRREHPEYYQHRHTPQNPWLRWDFLNTERDRD